MFDSNDSKQVTSWKEMSFDAKLFTVYFGIIFFLFICSSLFSLPSQIAIVTILVCVLAPLSIIHRIKNRWHWPGMGIKNLLEAIGALAIYLFFFGSITPIASPLQPKVFPWFAAGGGMILFSVLASLNFVSWSEKQFRTCCEDQIVSASQLVKQPFEPVWKRLLRTLYLIYFIAVWIIGVGFFWQFNIAFRDGSPEPTASQTETLVNHGKTIYITPEEKRFISLLRRGSYIGIPSAIILGVVLDFVVGAKIFSNTPSLLEMIKKIKESKSGG